MPSRPLRISAVWAPRSLPDRRRCSLHARCTRTHDRTPSQRAVIPLCVHRARHKATGVCSCLEPSLLHNLVWEGSLPDQTSRLPSSQSKLHANRHCWCGYARKPSSISKFHRVRDEALSEPDRLLRGIPCCVFKEHTTFSNRGVREFCCLQQLSIHAQPPDN